MRKAHPKTMHPQQALKDTGDLTRTWYVWSSVLSQGTVGKHTWVLAAPCARVNLGVREEMGELMYVLKTSIIINRLLNIVT